MVENLDTYPDVDDDEKHMFFVDNRDILYPMVL